MGPGWIWTASVVRTARCAIGGPAISESKKAVHAVAQQTQSEGMLIKILVPAGLTFARWCALSTVDPPHRMGGQNPGKAKWAPQPIAQVL
jgi:hypothetical protein